MNLNGIGIKIVEGITMVDLSLRLCGSVRENRQRFNR